MSKKYSYEYFESLTDKEVDTLVNREPDRASMLYAIYDFEPELYKERGESLLSEKPCQNCNEQTVYYGPNTIELENNRCLICGTVQD